MKMYVVFLWEPYEGGWPEKYFLDEDKAKMYVLESEAAEEDRLRNLAKGLDNPLRWVKSTNRNHYDYEEVEVIE